MASDQTSSADSPDSAQPSDDALGPGGHLGRQMKEAAPALHQDELGDKAQGATWRGWVVGLLCVAALSAFIPYSDLILQGTNLSWNAFPMVSVFFTVALILLANITFAYFRTRLGLTRQDLTLIFCMTMVTYTIPAVGFWVMWSTGVSASQFLASPENRFGELLHPHMPEGFFLKDPPRDVYGARPVEWFYTGLPPGESIPWLAWARPFGRWMIVVALMYGIWFCLAALLIRRWSEEERLPFPVAQVPEQMVTGGDSAEGKKKSFLHDRVLLWGLLLTFGLQSWNSMTTYIEKLPLFPLINSGVHRKFLTEPPWNAIGGLDLNIYPVIIGLTFLLSLEVAFSLWFSFVVLKGGHLFFGPSAGRQLVRETFQATGTGAVMGLVLWGFWMARKALGSSLLQAFGRRPVEKRSDELHPRTVWCLLVVCFVGVICWLSWLGVSPLYSVLIVLLFVLVMTGLARLIAEAGVFACQFYDFPVHILSMSVTPAQMGAKNLVLLTVWDRIFTADWFRIVPLPNLMNALHLARRTGLRHRTVYGATALAIAVVFGLSFFSYLGTVYTQGGANRGWFFTAYPKGEFGKISRKVAQVEAWREKSAKAEAEGTTIPEAQVPKVAQTNWYHLSWMGVGAIVLAGFMFVRQYIFWWPHPAGMMLWAAWYPHHKLWFSFFLGWLIKWAVLHVGGMKGYGVARRFFIGIIIGEALAAVFWVLVAMILGREGAYKIPVG